jgi:hemerythrin-like domain-containing protein
MRYASDDLMNEHEAILHGLTILEKMASEALAGKLADSPDPTAMIDFLKVFADACHHGKEESILFPAMERNGIARDRGPIGQMLLEHERGRTLIRAMSDSAATKPLDAKGFAANALEYFALLRAHIQKENAILFPMGDRAIPESEQLEILEAFERHEETVIGHGGHERLHAMLDEFTQKYAK